MRCESPFTGGAGEFACGKCPPCRINRKREWAGRLVAEWLGNPDALFVTLTYAEAPQSVSTADVQKFLKDLRNKLAPRPYRYFIVAEYGDKNFRPHYHAILYNVTPKDQPVIEEAWPHGFLYFGSVTVPSINYCVGYTLKKMTSADDPRLEGREPEFTRYSLKPGLGVGFLRSIGEGLTTYNGSAALAALGDVPHQFRTGGKHYPITAYRRRWMRQLMGWEPQTPAEALEKRAVQLAARNAEELKRNRDHAKSSGIHARKFIHQSTLKRQL